MKIQISELDNAMLKIPQSIKKSASEQYLLLTFCLQHHTDDGLYNAACQQTEGDGDKLRSCFEMVAEMKECI